MKFTVSFKTPDVVDDTLEYNFEREDFDSDEAYENAKSEAASLMEQYIEHGEYAHIDFDTEAGTATVRKQRG